jgi:hypothetical protein
MVDAPDHFVMAGLALFKVLLVRAPFLADQHPRYILGSLAAKARLDRRFLWHGALLTAKSIIPKSINLCK